MRVVAANLVMATATTRPRSAASSSRCSSCAFGQLAAYAVGPPGGGPWSTRSGEASHGLKLSARCRALQSFAL